MGLNKSLQATRDGVYSSAFAGYVCLTLDVSP